MDLVLVTTVVATLLWFSPSGLAPQVTLATAIGAGVAFTGLVGGQRGYDIVRVLSYRREYTVIVRAGWMWALLFVAVLYVGQVDVEPRSAIGAIMGGLILVLLARAGQSVTLKRRRRSGMWQQRTLVVGDPDQLSALVTKLQDQPVHGFDVVGLCTDAESSQWEATPVLGDIARAVDVIVEHGVRVVMIAASCMGARELRRFCWDVERHGVELLIVPAFDDVAPSRVAVRSVSGTSLMSLAVGPSWLQRTTKTVIDRVLGSLLLLLASPIVGVSALLVRATSPGPAFYTQTRMGCGEEQFTIIKLRTMYVDADARRSELLGDSDGNGVMFKMRDDPRITPVGRVLRRFSIDELPQLWNVVRGDMSLVGPRPPLEPEVAKYDQDTRQRMRVKPGLTGLWQVSGRSDLNWEQTVRLDLNYVDNRSLAMDVSILGRTFRAVFGGRGAY